MGVTESDLLEEMDLHSVECLNQVRGRFNVTTDDSFTTSFALQILTALPHLTFLPNILQATGKDWGNALKQGYREDPGIFCQSDDDEELILTVPFRQIVNLTSIAIQGPSDGTAPKTVKVFINKPNLSFENTGKKGAASFVLTPEQVSSGEALPLDFTDFQNVRCVSFFVDDNQGGGEVTNVSKIIVNGATVHTTNMTELKKC